MAGAFLACLFFLPTPEKSHAHGKVVCQVSGGGIFDPIVFPGIEPPVGHRHTFFASTRIVKVGKRGAVHYEDLEGSGTTCLNPDDTAAYWFPTVESNGKAIAVRKTIAYYNPGSARGAVHHLPVEVNPFPADLRLIAGERDGSGTEHVFWDCGDKSSRDSRYSSPAEARCDLATPDPGLPESRVSLRLKVLFPDCWDGRLNPHNLSGENTADFADNGSGQNHLTYASDGRRPDLFPIKVPELFLNIHFDYRGDGSDVTIASGQGTMHADFWNTWVQDPSDPEAQRGGLTTFVDQCVSFDGVGAHPHGSGELCGIGE